MPPNKLSKGLVPLPIGSDSPKRITTNAGPYAEAAHIKPVGKPHNGPDRPENLLCLCPNHHLMLDKGVYMIEDDLSLIGIEGSLTKHPDHEISIEHIRYHRMMFN